MIFYAVSTAALSLRAISTLMRSKWCQSDTSMAISKISSSPTDSRHPHRIGKSHQMKQRYATDTRCAAANRTAGLAPRLPDISMMRPSLSAGPKAATADMLPSHARDTRAWRHQSGRAMSLPKIDMTYTPFRLLSTLYSVRRI